MEQNTKFHTPTKRKKYSTRICTIQSVSSKDNIPAKTRVHTWKKQSHIIQQTQTIKTKIQHKTKTKMLHRLHQINSKELKIESPKKKLKRRKNKGKSKSEEIGVKCVKKEIEIRSVDGSSGMTELMQDFVRIEEKEKKQRLRDIQYELNAQISVSLATNQLINKIFENRKHRMGVCNDKNTQQKHNNFQPYKKNENFLHFRYSQIFPSALKSLHNIPHHLILNRNDSKTNNQSEQKFLKQTDTYIKESKKKWCKVHARLHDYIHQHEQNSEKSESFSILIRNKIKQEQIMSELKKQGQQNYRWFQFLENLDQRQMDFVFKKSENKQYLQIQEQKRVEEKVGPVINIESKHTGDVIYCSEQSQNQHQQDNIDEDSDNIGQMLMRNYNYDSLLWKQDQYSSSGSEQDILNNSDNQEQTNTIAAFYEKQSDQSSGLKIDYSQLNKEDEVLEQKTDIVLNWIIDEFVIELASQLNLDLFLGLQDSEPKFEATEITESKKLNNRIKQMFSDCEAIDEYNKLEDKVTPEFIIDALQETHEKISKPSRADPKNGKYSEKVCQALKRVIITRKDIPFFEQERRLYEQSYQLQIKYLVSQAVFIDIAIHEAIKFQQILSGYVYI